MTYCRHAAALVASPSVRRGCEAFGMAAGVQLLAVGMHRTLMSHKVAPSKYLPSSPTTRLRHAFARLFIFSCLDCFSFRYLYLRGLQTYLHALPSRFAVFRYPQRSFRPCRSLVRFVVTMRVRRQVICRVPVGIGVAGIWASFGCRTYIVSVEAVHVLQFACSRCSFADVMLPFRWSMCYEVLFAAGGIFSYLRSVPCYGIDCVCGTHPMAARPALFHYSQAHFRRSQPMKQWHGWSGIPVFRGCVRCASGMRIQRFAPANDDAEPRSCSRLVHEVHDHIRRPAVLTENCVPVFRGAKVAQGDSCSPSFRRTNVAEIGRDLHRSISTWLSTPSSSSFVHQRFPFRHLLNDEASSFE